MKQTRTYICCNLGENDPRFAENICNLAGLFRESGRLKLALPLYFRALELALARGDSAAILIATLYNNIGALYKAVNRPNQAKPYFEESLCILERVLGEDHPQTQVIRTSLNKVQQLLK